jgi:hypothetical protein
MAVPCEAARAHLGVATQRPGSAHARARTTPAVLALDALVTGMAAHLLGPNTLPVRTAAWDRQAHPTLSDTSALVRRGLWRHGHCATVGTEAEVVTIPRAR